MTLKALVCEVQMETNLVCYLPLNRSFKLQKRNVLKHKKYFKFTKHICKHRLILCLKYKMFCTMQNTMVLWSNLSCIRLEGWGFKLFSIQINKNLFAEVRAEEKGNTLTHRVSQSSSSGRTHNPERGFKPGTLASVSTWIWNFETWWLWPLGHHGRL